MLVTQISAGNWLIFKAHGVGGAWRSSRIAAPPEIPRGARAICILIGCSPHRESQPPPASHRSRGPSSRKSYSRTVIRLRSKSCTGNIEKLRALFPIPSTRRLLATRRASSSFCHRPLKIERSFRGKGKSAISKDHIALVPQYKLQTELVFVFRINGKSLIIEDGMEES